MVEGRKALTGRKMSQMNPWEIARHYGVGYSGDMSPIRHGGMFFDYVNWVKYGYASCVEFWPDPEDEDRVVVSSGVINRPDHKEEMERAFSTIGASRPDDMNNVFVQIEAVRAYRGFEENEWVEFDTEDSSYSAIWEGVREMIEALEGEEP